MLEHLLISMCIFGSGDACAKGAQAYYRYKGLDQNVRKVEKKYPNVVAAFTVAGLVDQKRISVPVYKGTIISVRVDDKTDRVETTLSYQF
jgi:hypothetical protein